MKVNCPNCGVELDIPNESANGQHFNCPSCGKEFVFRKPASFDGEDSDTHRKSVKPEAEKPVDPILIKLGIAMASIVGLIVSLAAFKCDPSYVVDCQCSHPESELPILLRRVTNEIWLYDIDKTLHLILAILCTYVIFRVLFDLFIRKS